MNVWSRYFHTLKFMKIRQILYRLYYKLPQKRVSSFKLPLEWIPLAQHIDWSGKGLTKLQAYHLHYFEGPISIEKIRSWIAYHDTHTTVGWDPYPVSQRIVRWIQWDLQEKALDLIAKQSLRDQVVFLNKRIEYHLLGNHLLANAKALIFAGLYFRETHQNTWFEKGIALLKKEIEEQILLDGGHFELSPMYHVLILKDLLELYGILKQYAYCIEFPLAQKIQKMIDWLLVMLHPDGEISFFNDATLGQAPSPLLVLTEAKALGFHYDIEKIQSMLLKDSGYARLQKGEMVVLADVGNIGPEYLPGHGHADHLSFEASFAGKRLFVNSGTSTYEVSAQRLLERSTKAHNTLVIDNENSSQVWASFRVARRAIASVLSFGETFHEIFLVAEHDGYQRLKGKPLHRRSWKLSENKLVIEDEIRGEGQHLLKVYFYFHPEIVVSIVDKDVSFMIEKKIFYFKIDPALKAVISPAQYYPAFGVEVQNTVLVLEYHGTLPQVFSYQLLWEAREEAVFLS